MYYLTLEMTCDMHMVSCSVCTQGAQYQREITCSVWESYADGKSAEACMNLVKYGDIFHMFQRYMTIGTLMPSGCAT